MATKQQAGATGTLTVRQVVAATGVTEMTVLNWRKGTYAPSTKEGKARPSKLPCRLKKVGSRHRVEFDRDKFLSWADKHGVAVDLKELR